MLMSGYSLRLALTSLAAALVTLPAFAQSNFTNPASTLHFWGLG